MFRDQIDTILHVAEGNQALTFEDFKRGSAKVTTDVSDPMRVADTVLCVCYAT